MRIVGTSVHSSCIYGPTEQPNPPPSINPAGDDANDGDRVGGMEMTPAVLKAAALAHDGYETPALNDRLYLHYRVRFSLWSKVVWVKWHPSRCQRNEPHSPTILPMTTPPRILHQTQGFRRLSRHLAAYSGLKALWLDSNGLTNLSFSPSSSSSAPKRQEEDDDNRAADQFDKEGGGSLRALSQLRCLYLQNNLLVRLADGLRGLAALVTLDVRCGLGCWGVCVGVLQDAKVPTSINVLPVCVVCMRFFVSWPNPDPSAQHQPHHTTTTTTNRQPQSPDASGGAGTSS